MASTLAISIPVTNHARQIDLELAPVYSTTSEAVASDVVRLDQLSPHFSFSYLLSPLYNQEPPVIVDDGTLLDSIYIINLALNEECSKLCKGCFYHMPLRQDSSKGHPCDLVFVDEDWGSTSIDKWNSSNWKQRLEMCDAVRKLKPREHIIPICCRIMKASQLTSTTNVHLYATASDPAIAKHGNVLTYSRPLENKSRVLLSYRNQHGQPHLYLMDTVEHTLVSTGFTTPGDLSETFIPHSQTSSTPVFGRTSVSPYTPPSSSPSPATKLLHNHVASNRDVVLMLLHTFNNGQPLQGIDNQDHIIPFNFKDTRYTWQEIKNRVKLTAQDMEFRRKMLQAISISI